MTKGDSRLKIHSGLGDDVEDWGVDDAQVFLGENKRKYGISEDNIQVLKDAEVCSSHLLFLAKILKTLDLLRRQHKLF